MPVSDGYETVTVLSDSEDTLVSITRDRSRHYELTARIIGKQEGSELDIKLDTRNGKLSYAVLDPSQRGYAIPVNQQQFDELLQGNADVRTALESTLNATAAGIKSERERNTRLHTPAPRQRKALSPKAERELKEAAMADLALTQYDTMEERAQEIWVEGQSVEALADWDLPQRPREEAAIKDFREAGRKPEPLEQNTWRFYEQKQMPEVGDRARLFGFNAETGESLTWEWDKEKKCAIVEGEDAVLESLQKLPYWEGMVKMINEKAASLSEKPGAHASRILEERGGEAAKGAQR